MYNEKTQTQYEIMTEENKTENRYIPNLEALIQEAPCEEMAKAWKQVADLIETTKDKDFKFGGFAFRCVYTHKKADGTYTIYQHPMPNDWDMEKCEAELERWIIEVEN